MQPLKTTPNHLLLRKEEIRSKPDKKLHKNFKLVKKTSMPKTVKALLLSSAAARVTPDLLKVLPDTTTRRPTVEKT